MSRFIKIPAGERSEALIPVRLIVGATFTPKVGRLTIFLGDTKYLFASEYALDGDAAIEAYAILYPGDEYQRGFDEGVKLGKSIAGAEYGE